MNYHNITTDDMLNGDGLRVVLWVSGCSHHCNGCQNPITWNENDGLPFKDSDKKEIYKELEKDYISGITFSGGDPLHCNNIDTITFLAKEIKSDFPTKTIWLYSGYDWEDVKNKEIMKYTDVFVDGKFIKELADINYKWAGSTNQKVIDVQKSLKEKKVVLYANY